MNLGNDLRAVLPELRSAAESFMPETIRAGRIILSTDPDTGDAVQTVGEPVIYEGPARFKYEGTAPQENANAGQLVFAQSVIMKLPAGSVLLPEGTGVHVISSEFDDTMAGRTYRVDGAPASGAVTAHRYPVTELT